MRRACFGGMLPALMLVTLASCRAEAQRPDCPAPAQEAPAPASVRGEASWRVVVELPEALADHVEVVKREDGRLQLVLSGGGDWKEQRSLLQWLLGAVALPLSPAAITELEPEALVWMLPERHPLREKEEREALGTADLEQLPYSKLVRRAGRGHYRVAPEALRRAMADPAALAKSIESIPYRSEDIEGGVEVLAVRPGGFFHALGLRNGDVVFLMGEAAPTSQKDLLDFCGLLLERRMGGVGLSRGGALDRPQTFIYEVREMSAAEEAREAPPVPHVPEVEGLAERPRTSEADDRPRPWDRPRHAPIRAREVDPGVFEIDAADLDAQLADLGQVGRQARIIPALKDGAYRGYKLIGVRPGSLYRAVGLHSGDVVLRVDEVELSSPARTMEVYSALGDKKVFAIDIERRGEPLRLTVRKVEGLAEQMGETHAAPELPPADRPDPPDDGEIRTIVIEIDADRAAAQLADLGRLGRDARIVPNYRGGRYQGFKLVGVKPGSLFRAIGIRSGDIVRTVDGRELDTPNKAIGFLQALQDQPEVVFGLERRGRPLQLTVRKVEGLAGRPDAGPIEPADVRE